jgi:hypothetical protein
MKNHGMNRMKIRRSAGLRCIGGLATASMMLVGCADVGDPNAGGTGAKHQSVARVQSAVTVDCSTIQVGDASVDVKKLLGLGADLVKAYFKQDADSYITIATDLWNLDGSPSVDDLMANLNAKLLCFAQASDWKELALDYNDNQFAPVSAAFMEAQSVPFPRGTFYDGSSHDGTVASGGLVMFERLYGAGDPATNGAWKNTITNNHPDVIDNSQVFDWRMALPGFVRLLGARLAIIGTMDQNFTTSGQWTPELGDGTSSFPGYRGVLTARLQQMIAGVRCDYKDRLKALGNPQTRSTSVAYDHTDVACADVNTGLNVITTYVRPDNNCGTQVWAPFLLQCLNNLPSTANMPSLEDGVRRQVLHQMPVFEMQSLIDALYLYTHPATDLTAGAGRIPLAANPGLCVDVPGANPAAGTQVQIYSCNAGTPQQFSYDREAATITNTALGNCLQVRQPDAGSAEVDVRPGSGNHPQRARHGARRAVGRSAVRNAGVAVGLQRRRRPGLARGPQQRLLLQQRLLSDLSGVVRQRRPGHRFVHGRLLGRLHGQLHEHLAVT